MTLHSYKIFGCVVFIVKNEFVSDLQQNLRTNEVENLKTASLKPKFTGKNNEISQITS